jgi:hypothetical protein
VTVRASLAGVLLLALFAGCLGSDEDPQVPDPMEGYTSPADPVPEDGDADHDHGDPAQHLFAKNATLEHWDDLRRFGWTEQTWVGAHAVDVRGDTLVAAVNGGDAIDGQQGFHIFDVSDGLEHKGFYQASMVVRGDRTIALSEDGKTAFLGYEGKAIRPGVSAVDISDPANPKEVAFWSDPQDYGAHTVSVGKVDGQDYVFALAQGVSILRYESPLEGGAGFTMVGKFLTADELALLDAYKYVDAESGTPEAAARAYALRSIYGHDMTFYDDPVSGKPLLLVAYAYEGLKVVDLSDPRLPVILTRWMPPEDTDHRHYTHSVVAERQSDGRLLLVVGSETFEEENQGIASPIWILDATAAVLAPPLTMEPTHLSTWRNPGGAAAGHLGLSVHFFRLQEGLLVLSHYHAGVWGIDLRTPEAQADPQAFAYIMPVPPGAIEAPETAAAVYEFDRAPLVFDAAWGEDGMVYAADMIQGVTATRFELPV